jgi:uncharacterized membrane protein SpoIIM required for sporulation
MRTWLYLFCNKNYTTCFIDSAFGYDWGSCSERHDKRYINKRLTRKQADELLYRCFKRKVNIVFAFIGYFLVRIFGGYFYKQSQRNIMTHDQLEQAYLKDKHRKIEQDAELSKTLIKLNETLHDIKHSQSKFGLIFIGVLIFGGVMIGTQYKIWLPYLQDGYKVAKTISSTKVQ